MTPPRNSRHDREAVLDAALQLLDEVGLPDLSMRRLATELAVQPSALYWHFTSKQELFGALADRILSRVTETDTLGPREERVMSTAHSIRDALLTYRDGAELVLSSRALRQGAVHAHRMLHTALDDIPQADAIATALLEFILGHTTLLQQRMHAESYGATNPEADDSVDESAVFDIGVRALVKGAALTSRSPQTPV